MGAGKIAGILTANAALSSILAMMLRGHEGLKVRQFASARALVAYVRVVPIDVLVCDADLPDTTLATLVGEMRHRPESLARGVRIIALARHIDGALRAAVVGAGIDEVVVKPMSPAHVMERVLARLSGRSQTEPAPTGPAPRWRGERPRPVGTDARHSAEIIDFLARRGERAGLSPQA